MSDSIFKYEDIYDAVTSLPNGRFFKICYRTEMPLKAEYKNQGYKVYKYTYRITRTGVSYNNLKKVRASGKEFSRASNTKWLIKNKIKTNVTTGKDYIVIATMAKNEYKEYSYVIIYPDGIEKRKSSAPADMIIPSYFEKKNGAVRNINLDNVVFISYKGEVIYGNVDL
ncbi:MAG: hypothetical protein J6R47_05725 [Acholeplasmatales bacterium]|nr:hypothetical protein [Acholeplasmatales bacterium]